MTSNKVLVALTLLAAAACGGPQKIVVNGIEVYENHWNKAKADIQLRAVQEMSCSPEQLDYTLLSRSGRAPTVVTVRGCGKTALYERNVQRAGLMSMSSIWTLSSVKDEAPALEGTPGVVAPATL
jgi:hypothetical protein